MNLLPDRERNELQRRFLVLVGTLGGLLFIVIGFSLPSVPVVIFGVIGVIAGVLQVVKDAKKRKAAKQKAAEEAEIRAYQLRQARGQVPPQH